MSDKNRKSKVRIDVEDWIIYNRDILTEPSTIPQRTPLLHPNARYPHAYGHNQNKCRPEAHSCNTAMRKVTPRPLPEILEATDWLTDDQDQPQSLVAEAVVAVWDAPRGQKKARNRRVSRLLTVKPTPCQTNRFLVLEQVQ